MDFDHVLLALRGLAHFATFCIIAGFTPHGCRYRRAISMLAVLLAGGSLMLAMHVATRWHALIEHPQTLATLCALLILALAAYSRGNVAKMIPSVKRFR